MKSYLKYASVYALVLLVLVASSSGPIGAEPLYSPENTMTGRILTKGQNTFSVVERTFIVTQNTDIRAYDNTKLSFEAFPVPCDADITFKVTNQNALLCLKLKVKSVLKRENYSEE